MVIMNGVVIPAFAAFITVSTVVSIEKKQALPTPEPVVEVYPLKLEKPKIDWIAPNSMDGQATMCLDSQSFMVHQMYIQGLEHIKRTCLGEENPLYAKR
jgi:hypothetical protein